tara:strand:- start:31 stop:366 length:336 start_codon:yes stop_codon:yes gene_type:complete
MAFKMKGFSPFNMGEAYNPEMEPAMDQTPMMKYGKTPMKKPLVGGQSRLPEELKEKILASPAKKYGKTPMKKDSKKKDKAKAVRKAKKANKKKSRSYKKFSNLAKRDDDRG